MQKGGGVNEKIDVRFSYTSLKFVYALNFFTMGLYHVMHFVKRFNINFVKAKQSMILAKFAQALTTFFYAPYTSFVVSIYMQFLQLILKRVMMRV